MGTLSKFTGRGGLELQPWYNPLQFFRNDLVDWNGDVITIPAINISEEKSEFKVELAVPGLKKEDFNVNVDGNVITVSCEKETEMKEGKEDKNFFRTEYNYSSFSRSFTVPETADVNHIEAKYNDGILRLSIPKRPDIRKNKMQKIKVE